MSDALVLRPAVPTDADAIAEIHLRSRRVAMPWLAQPHSDAETREWTRTVKIPRGGCSVALVDGMVAGYSWTSSGWLDGLYIDPDHQGHGIGSALFERAQQAMPEGFDLWVFQRNHRALEFYARYACEEVRPTDGADNEEREPDVLLRWSPTSQ